MKAKEYQQVSGKTYHEIGKEMGQTKQYVCAMINEPGVTKLKTFLRMTAIIDMPEEEATKEWKVDKLRYINKNKKYKRFYDSDGHYISREEMVKQLSE